MMVSSSRHKNLFDIFYEQSVLRKCHFVLLSHVKYFGNIAQQIQKIDKWYPSIKARYRVSLLFYKIMIAYLLTIMMPSPISVYVYMKNDFKILYP